MKKIFILLIATAFAFELKAQSGGGSFMVSYPISFPMSSGLKDYIGEPSFRGFSMEFNKLVKDNVEVGLEFSWHVFYQREEDQPYTHESATISGIQYRYTNTFPMLLGAKWYKKTNSKAIPYAGLGLGTIYVDRSTDFGLYRISNTAWQFALRPELGLRIKAGSGVDGLIGLKYYTGFETDELAGHGYLSVNIGFVFHSGGL
jgi:outer membrane protein W